MRKINDTILIVNTSNSSNYVIFNIVCRRMRRF